MNTFNARQAAGTLLTALVTNEALTRCSSFFYMIRGVYLVLTSYGPRYITFCDLPIRQLALQSPFFVSHAVNASCFYNIRLYYLSCTPGVRGPSVLPVLPSPDGRSRKRSAALNFKPRRFEVELGIDRLC
jgi:hypothetical protein